MLGQIIAKATFPFSKLIGWETYVHPPAPLLSCVFTMHMMVLNGIWEGTDDPPHSFVHGASQVYPKLLIYFWLRQGANTQRLWFEGPGQKGSTRESESGTSKRWSGNVFIGFLACSRLLLLMTQYSLQMNTAVLSWQELCLRIWWESVVFHRIYAVLGLIFFYHLFS